MRTRRIVLRLLASLIVVCLFGVLAGNEVEARFFRLGILRRPACVCPPPCPDSPAVKVRKNINHLSETELASFKRGVAAMKALPDNDPRSWRFQANIHGSTDPVPPDGVGLFNSCAHNSVYFFVWHRGYLYNFESILRELSGDSNFTLPYWDWETSPSLPEAFRNPMDPAGVNPLFDGTRNINDGSALPAIVVVDRTVAALALTPFYNPVAPPSFSRSFEGSPHGSVHGLTGGNMTAFATAGRDPIFWLHHCNIDRNLDRWLNLGAGRTNPSDAAFLDKPYFFIDKAGAKVTTKVRDMLHSSKLGYRYEDTPNPATMAALAFRASLAQPTEKPKLLRVAATFKDEKPPAAKKPLGLKTIREDLHLEPKTMADWRALKIAPNATGKVLLQIHGISAKETPAFVYGVYLNLPDKEVPADQKRKYLAGTIDFFGKLPHENKDHGHGGEGTGFMETYDVSALVSALQKEKRWQAEKLDVTFEPITPIASKGNEAALQQRLEASAKKAEITYQNVQLLIAP